MIQSMFNIRDNLQSYSWFYLPYCLWYTTEIVLNEHVEDVKQGFNNYSLNVGFYLSAW